MKNNQDGFTHVVLVIVVIILFIIIGLGGYLLFGMSGTQKVVIATVNEQNSTQLPDQETENTECEAKPILPLPVDKTFIESVLYPGQLRGGDYKAHGGFRLNTPTTTATIYLPVEASVIAVARYLEQGEIQYLFDFETKCNIRLRFDHIAVPSPYLAELAEELPTPVEGDSKTTKVLGRLMKKGESVATKVGFETNKNVTFDFGLYDYNQKNSASSDPAWAAAHPSENEKYAVCWFDYLSEEDEAYVRTLPAADQKSGKTSDYCL